MYSIDEQSVLEKLYEQDHFLTLMEIEAFWPFNFKEKSGHTFRVLSTLVNKGLVVARGRAEAWMITADGRKAIEEDWERIKREKEAEIISHNKLKDDAKISRWMRKSYWWTFSFSILGVILGSTALLKDCNKKGNEGYKDSSQGHVENGFHIEQHREFGFIFDSSLLFHKDRFLSKQNTIKDSERIKER